MVIQGINIYDLENSVPTNQSSMAPLQDITHLNASITFMLPYLHSSHGECASQSGMDLSKEVQWLILYLAKANSKQYGVIVTVIFVGFYTI